MRALPNVKLHNLGAGHWTHVEELFTETGCTAEEAVLGIHIFIPSAPRRSSAFSRRLSSEQGWSSLLTPPARPCR